MYNIAIKELDNIILKIEEERFYWMNELNITVGKHEQAIFID